MRSWFILIPFISVAALVTFLNNTDIYSYFFVPDVEMENRELRLDEPLILDFNHPVIQHKIESSFSINPEVVGRLEWHDKKLVFTPVTPWEPSSTYKFSLKGMTATSASFSFEDTFNTESLPKIASYSPAPGTTVGLKGPVRIELDKSARGCHLDFKIAPEIDYDLEIDSNRRVFTIVPKNNLDQDTAYQVISYLSFNSNEDKLWHRKELTNFFVKTVPPPRFEKANPSTGQENIKSFNPVRFYFDKPLQIENWEQYIQVTPQVRGKVEWEENGRVLVYKPSRWKDNTSYKVRVLKGAKAQDGTELKEDVEVSFETIDSSGFTHSRTANADPYIREGKYIDINLSQQLLSIFEDGINLGSYKISTGKRGMATPAGSYRVMNKNPRKWSYKYKLYMPYWMQFTGAGHGIHELPEWPNGYKEGTNHLGIPVSHGCVRLGIGAAETVYQWSPVGTTVYVHY